MGYFDPHSYEDMEAQAGGVACLGGQSWDWNRVYLMLVHTHNGDLTQVG